MHENKLPLTEELDFQYLLGLMMPLHECQEFAWLPELFSIIGYESLIDLCKYAGGEIIKIPTLEQLSRDIDAVRWFYETRVARTRTLQEVPSELSDIVTKISEIYDARNCEEDDSR